MRWLPTSTIRKPPSAVGETLNGIDSRAAVAWAPSPLKPCTPVPATVVMTPAGETLRIRWLFVSAIRMPPSGERGHASRNC